jgi:hypothetical protein
MPLSQCFCLSLALVVGLGATAGPVTLHETESGHELRVDGEPFTIKGAGGDADKALLAEYGGNAFRTWGIDETTADRLAEAEKHGLKVALGIWLGHTRHGFSYDDADQVQKQFDDARAAVLKYKDHPAVLLWGVGNEMEEYAAETDPKMWKAVNDIAAMIKQLDPDHPTMTVTAEIGGDRLESIETYCPEIDIVGINSYGGVTSIPERYAAAEISKPYIVTEFGPPGTWEISKNDWDVPLELTSTEKAEIYKNAYEVLDADPNCLGSFAFTWGFKQEATATWFGMFLPNGSKLAAVDAMHEVWTGSPPANLCPVIERFEVIGSPQVEPDARVIVELDVTDPEGKTPRVEWVLFEEMEVFESMGDFRPTPPTFPKAIGEHDHTGATVTMPERPGNYRLIAYMYDGDGGAAVANVPLKVKGEVDTRLGAQVNLPLVVYGDNVDGMPYAPSGYMGDYAAITMDEKSTEAPHRGATCLAVSFNQTSGWGGVVWQSPANDWGDQQGGYDLRDAGVLSFWARGARGGEQVKFGFGLIGQDKPFYDTGKAEKTVTLTDGWKQYKLPLSGRDLSCIKSGFYWTVAASGQPIKFFLDDVVYTDGDGQGADGGAAAAAGAVDLPVKVLADGLTDLPWVPSGYMGESGSITMDETWADHPHTGPTCTKVQYNHGGGWGGVVWQHPANDWGDQPGGHNVSGADQLSFWARGAEGGEKVKFGFGLLGCDAVYPDTGKGEIEVTLTDQWKQYRVSTRGQDLSRIKTGFYWVVAGQGQPLTFYLDDIAFTSDASEPE